MPAHKPARKRRGFDLGVHDPTHGWLVGLAAFLVLCMMVGVRACRRSRKRYSREALRAWRERDDETRARASEKKLESRIEKVRFKPPVTSSPNDRRRRGRKLIRPLTDPRMARRPAHGVCHRRARSPSLSDPRSERHAPRDRIGSDRIASHRRDEPPAALGAEPARVGRGEARARDAARQDGGAARRAWARGLRRGVGRPEASHVMCHVRSGSLHNESDRRGTTRATARCR